MFAEDSLSLIFFYISSIFLLQIYLFEKYRLLQLFVQKLSPNFCGFIQKVAMWIVYVKVCEYTYSL